MINTANGNKSYKLIMVRETPMEIGKPSGGGGGGGGSYTKGGWAREAYHMASALWMGFLLFFTARDLTTRVGSVSFRSESVCICIPSPTCPATPRIFDPLNCSCL